MVELGKQAVLATEKADPPWSGIGKAGKDEAKARSKRCPHFSPQMLCEGARALGLDLPGFQAVAVAAAEVRGIFYIETRSPVFGDFVIPDPFQDLHKTLEGVVSNALWCQLWWGML